MTRALAIVFFGFLAAAEAASPFEGTWAFELPDSTPAWLKVEGDTGSMLWSVGNPRPVKALAVEGDVLTFVWKRKWRPFGKADAVRMLDGKFTGKMIDGGVLELTGAHFAPSDPEKLESIVLRGKKMPPLPARPDPSKVEFGAPVRLFNGEDLKGWKLSNPAKKNGWRASDGVLINETPKTDFSAYGEFGNLVTEAEFEDFRLSLEYNAPKDGNSGVYLRGMYEAQVVDRDSKMQGLSGPGAVFGRILPTENAGKAGGEWNRYVLTLVDRHITVELNGKTVIDNQPLEGCTGGGISADDTAPGPLFLQGDHTSVRYRNIVLEPVGDTIPLDYRGLWSLPKDLDGDGVIDIDLYFLLSEREVVTLGPEGAVHWPDTTGWVDGEGTLWMRSEGAPIAAGKLGWRGDQMTLGKGKDVATYARDLPPLSKADAIELLEKRYEKAPDRYRNNIPQPRRRSVVLPK